MIIIHPFTKRLLAVCCAATLGAPLAWSQTFDIMTFDVTSQGPWSDIASTTLQVPKVANNSIKLDANVSSAEYGGFKGVTVTPGVNAWILDYPADRAWDGPADSSFTYYLAHDDNYFYVGVDAKDDIVNSDDVNASFWEDDAIEIVVDALNDRLDNNVDNSNDPYGGHCYVNYQGRFSRWDDTTNTRNDGVWCTNVDWKYGPNDEIYGFGTNVTGGWKMEVRFKKTLFQDPTVGNKLDNNFSMGFNIGLDDDDKHGPGANGDGSRSADLEIQYFWANRLRHIGLTPDKWAALTADQQNDQSYLEANFPSGIDSNGRLSHGGTGQIIFAPAAVATPANFNPITMSGGKITISWTGTGTLQSSTSFPASWTDVTPAPTGNSYTVTPTGQARTFFRLRSGATATQTTVPCEVAVPDSVWVNTSMPDQTGTFTVQFEATPSQNPIDSVMALSAGAGTAFSSFACLTRFYEGDGTIQARNGSTYQADNTIPYGPNATYKFRMVVNVPAHTYSTYVTPPGGTEQTVGANYAFRTEQNTVTHLNNWGIIVDTTGATGTNTVCNFHLP